MAKKTTESKSQPKPVSPKSKKKAVSKPKPLPISFPPTEQEKSEVKDFTEIGSSPVPGLTLRQVLRRHTGYITRIAWSQDGKYLASPSADKTIRIWDMRTGVCVHTLQGHTTTVYSVAWSPDSQRLASASDDNTIRLWDITSGKLLQTLNGHNGEVFSVAWSPDGQKIASASSDKTIRLWNAHGRILQTLVGHSSWVLSVAWSPDSQHLVSASQDNNICLWDAASGQLLRTLKEHSNSVWSVAWSPDSQRFISASADGTFRLWNAVDGRVLQVFEGHTEWVSCAIFSANDRWLASKSSDNTVRLWRRDIWACVAVLDEIASSKTWATSIAFHPHLPIFATLGEKDTIIRIWELNEDILLSQAKENVNYTTAKLVLVGDSGVGKTGLGWRLAHGEFKEHASTHGQQFWSIPELGLKRKDGVECETVLWDLAGQHVYRQVHSIFLDNVAAALVVFDPTNRQDPLKGVQFWLEELKGKGQLPPTVLVGARVDRGAPALSQADLDQFCQRYGITGGYLSTSAMSGEGLGALLEKLKAQIPWEDMTATVTTVTFKRIKDYVLSLKEKTDRKGVLVSPKELRSRLEQWTPKSPDFSQDQETSQSEKWKFTDAEMMTAVGHLETHGYITILQNSAGEQYILLNPELLVNIAASIILLADKNSQGLGAVSETNMQRGKYPFEELRGLEKQEAQPLIDAAILRFLEHNICLRETLGNDTLLIFPSLIKQKRPLQDDTPATDDISYVVRGRVENLYASLVVLLGYTPSFMRINQWQNQAQYEMGAGEICGFRMIEEHEGEIELVLYYGEKIPKRGRDKFQELFEQFLYQRDVEVTRFPPVICGNGHRIERATVIKRLREGKDFVFCNECGEKAPLPNFEKLQTIGIGASTWLQLEEATARLRNSYEVYLTLIKSYRRSWATPRCYISYIPEQSELAKKLIHDLQGAGIFIAETSEQVMPEDFLILLDKSTPDTIADKKLINKRLKDENKKVFHLFLTGKVKEHTIRSCNPSDFCDETHYSVNLFDLVLNLYAIPFNHPGFAPLRQKLHEQWEQSLAAKKANLLEDVFESNDVTI